jgi:carbon starvation protein
MSQSALSNPELPKRALSWVIWTGITALGAFALAGIALNRNEPISAAWLVTAAICVYLISYRFYSKFIAEKVLQLDDTRMTPAERHNDGLDYVPTNRYVVFGHHFAAIAGAGPLVGPVLAAQMGYLPGTLWILVGVVFAGAVQDFVILFCSMRRDVPWLWPSSFMAPSPLCCQCGFSSHLAITSARSSRSASLSLSRSAFIWSSPI